MMQTLSFVRAHADRAKQEGAKTVSVSLVDLEEILRAAESHMRRDRGHSAKKSAGFVKPTTLAAMLAGKIRTTRLRPKRQGESIVELFFDGTLWEIAQAQQASKGEKA